MFISNLQVLFLLPWFDLLFSVRPEQTTGAVEIDKGRGTRRPPRYKQERERSEWVFASKRGNLTWPYRDQVAVIEGNLTLGGLMMVHERSEDMICGKIMPQGGLQATEAMLYTIDKVNELNIIPGVTLGARIKDDCDRDIYGLEQSVDFIRGAISNIGGTSEYQCKDGKKPEMMPGVVAAPSSVTSIQVANLLKLFKIPQVSFFSTSPALSNDERFPFFLRTIPSDKNQAEAMVELVKLFEWKYVSIVYEESSYGQMGFSEVESLLKKEGVCIAWTEKLIKDSGVAAAHAYDAIAQNLWTQSRGGKARGVIVFGSDQEVGELMHAVARNNLTGHFTWIGSDGWGGRTLAFKGKELQVEGAVTIQPYAEPIQGFEEYFLNLRPDTNKRNPWFIEYWEMYFRCRYANSSETPYNQNFSRQCNGSEKQTPENGYEPEAQLQFVSDAVMAFAMALKNMHEDYCGGEEYPGICEEMDPYDGELLRNYLLHVEFTGLTGQRFHFLRNGDGVPRYRILNFRQAKPGEFEWVTVGTFENQTLKVNKTELRFTLEHPTHPSSLCSEECAPHQAKETGGDLCCWNCRTCTTYQYLPTKHKCEECPDGTIPTRDLSACIPLPEEYLRYENPIAMGAMVFSGLGVFVTCYVMYVFLKYRETPVVKASGRELSFVLLGGILCCYGMTFVIVSKPNHILCAAQKFGIGFCFSICYSALLTKTNRIARIFRAGKRTVKRPKFISPKSQLVICGALVGVQVLIGALWLVISPPSPGYFYPTRASNQLVCKSAVGSGYIIGFSFPILLIIICTIYAILTRKIPEAFNESKYIGFTMYTTCILWLAFVPIYFTTAKKIEIRLVTLCFAISLSATVSLVCLFTPKLYIIMLRPERNVRQSMMGSKSSSKHNSYNSSQHRLDSCSHSDNKYDSESEIELHQRLHPSGSLSSGLSRCTSGTQTCSNGTSISTQTLDSVDRCLQFDDMDVQL